MVLARSLACGASLLLLLPSAGGMQATARVSGQHGNRWEDTSEVEKSALLEGGAASDAGEGRGESEAETEAETAAESSGASEEQGGGEEQGSGANADDTFSWSYGQEETGVSNDFPVQSVSTGQNTLNIEFFVMSKCPSARWWEQRILPVLKEVPDKVSVSFTFIPKLTWQPGSGDVTCLHGDNECAGNRQRLCVQKYGTVAQLLGFAICQGKDTTLIPSSGAACATGVGFDTQLLSTCADGDEGYQLLEESATRARSLDIHKSCTIMVENQEWQGNNTGLESCGACNTVATCMKLQVCCGLPTEERSASTICEGI